MRLHTARARLPLRRVAGRRYVQVTSTPVSEAPPEDGEQATSLDAKFEVIGSPYSLLSVSLTPSQTLHTRRGTLVAVSGKTENAVSTLSMLSPVRRTLFGIPFLYQKISSPTPLSLLISTKRATTSFSVVHLDGRVDWIVAQRNALLAWTGHNLSVSPQLSRHLTFQNWGSTFVTGRGLLGLVGNGLMYQINVKSGETYIVHPSNVVAYSSTVHPPRPYRFKSSTLKLQVPSIDFSKWLPNTRFWRTMRDSATWRFLSSTAYTIRTWARRSIFGDRLFLQFTGPCTLLLQSRASRFVDSLSNAEVNEIADAETGSVERALGMSERKEIGHGSSPKPELKEPTPKKVHYATVAAGGKVNIE